MRFTARIRRRCTVRELLATAALCALGCHGVATIEVERRSMAVLYADERPGELDMPELRDLSMSTFDNTEDMSSDDLAHARLTRLLVRTVDPPDADLAFADRIDVFVSAPGVERRRIASRRGFPVGLSSVELRLDGVELEPYLVAREFSITATVYGETPRDDTLIETVANLDVRVTLGAVCERI